MEARTIRTAAGTLKLEPVTIDQLRGIASYWPMEVLASEGEGYGLVFQHGDEEVHGVKLQPVDVPAEDAVRHHHLNRALIAAALPQYLARRHRGVMVPCAYYRKKAEGTAETGFALFVGPDAGSESDSGRDDDSMFDGPLGAGATPMIFDFVRAIGAAGAALHFPLLTLIGIEVRPRLALGGLAMHFVVEGPRVVVVKDPLDEEEPVWTYVVKAGFSSLPYAPMQPMGFAGEPPADIRRM